MHALVLVVLLFCRQLPATGNQKAGQPPKQEVSSQRVSDPSPVTVYVTQNPSQPQSENPQRNTHNEPEINWSNWALVAITAGALFFAIRNLRAIESQVVEMRKTGEQTDKLIKENIAQSASLEKSVAAAARSATAMEGVAKSLESTAKVSSDTLQGMRKQMRAYLTVVIGGGFPQNREQNLRFDGRPTVYNAGPTPAKNVRTRTKAAILPIPLPEDFDQSIPIDEEEGGNVIGAHQNAQMMAVVDNYVSDDQVEDIMIGKGQGMYVWGSISYDDIFGESHSTKFCQHLTYLPDGKVFGYYIAGRNDAD